MNLNWRAYAAVFKRSWVNMLEYRSETVVRILIALISMISMYYLWNDVFAERAVMAGYSKEQVVTYYLLVSFIFAALYAAVPVSEEIQEGRFSMYLLRPANYLWFNYWQSLARRVFRFLMGLPVLLIFFWLFREHLYFVTNPASYVFLFVSCLGAINILFLIDLLQNLGEFWVTNIDSWSMLVNGITMFFAGAMIPLSLLPTSFRIVSDWLPFRYAGTFLVDGFLGKLSWTEMGWGLLIQAFWTLVMLGLTTIVWRRGLRRYEAYGG